MFTYHPKIRRLNKLFLNNYYKELLENDNEYYYDLIINGFKLLNGGSNDESTNNESNNKNLFHLKLLMKKKSTKKETNVNILQKNNGTPIKNNSKILFYEEKDTNNDNKQISILFLGTKKNRCLIMKIIDNIAYLENLTKDELFPDSKDVDEMISFSIDYCKKNNVKQILLNDESEFFCHGHRISLAKWYILLYGNTYYGIKFGFVPQNNHNHVSKIRSKLRDKTLEDLLIDIGDPDFNDFIKKYHPSMPLQDFFREIRKEKKYCHLLKEIIDKTFELFHLKFNEGIMYFLDL